MNEIKRTYASIDDVPANAVPVMMYEPLHPGEKNHVGIVLQHSDDCYFEFTPALELAKRGYVVAVSCFPDRRIALDRKLEHVGKVTAYLRNYPGVDRVLLLGHSGGATLMSAYQAVAENGNAVFQDAGKIIPLTDIPPLPRADGMIFLDANLGNGAMTLLSLDPAVADEESGRERKAALDLFNPENGYDPEESHYSDDFIRTYVRAQGERMNHLIDYAMERVRAIESGAGKFEDDEPMIIPGGAQIAPYNKIFPMFPQRFFSHTEGAWDLICRDGSIRRGIVHCRRAERKPLEGTRNYHNGTLCTTVRNFLNSNAVRTNGELHYDETRIHGIDWDSSYCTGPGNAIHIEAPMLLLGMTGSYEYIAAEHIYQRAVKCVDKTLAFVEGAGHNFTPAADAERYPGEFGDTVRSTFDYTDQWIAQRFV